MGGPDVVTAGAPLVPEVLTVSPLAPTFEKFAKIPRLRTCALVVTEKIDGTNAQIYISEDPEFPVLAASRNRWITPGKGTDNYAFAEWVAKNEAALRRLGPGRHFGEWWGVGIGRGYGLSERRWSLFDAGRWTGKLPEGLPANVGVVPVLGIRQMWSDKVQITVIQDAIERLRTEGSVACPGYNNPEGVVVQVGYGKALYKFTLDGDALDARKTPSPEE